MAENSIFMKLTMGLYYKFFGKDIETIVKIIFANVEKSKSAGLYAFKLNKAIDLRMETFRSDSAEKLNSYTSLILKSYL